MVTGCETCEGQFAVNARESAQMVGELDANVRRCQAWFLISFVLSHPNRKKRG